MSKAEPKPFAGQHEGEEVQLVFRHHLSVLRKELIFAMLAILLTALPIAFADVLTWQIWLWLAGLTAGFTYLFYFWIGWYYSVYIVTDERIIEIQQKGLFNRRVSEYGLDKVQNINYHIQGLEEMLLRIGDITVQTYVGDLVMHAIHHPVKIHEHLVQVVRRYASQLDDRPHKE